MQDHSHSPPGVVEGLTQSGLTQHQATHRR